MVGEAGEEAEATTNKRGVVVVAIEEVGVVKTTRNIIAELRTSENEGKKIMRLNIVDLPKYR